MVRNQSDLMRAAPIKNMDWSKRKEHGVSHGLSEAGYDIRIKQEIRFDPQHSYAYSDEEKRAKVAVGATDEDGEVNFIYRDGRFALASAIEEFDMPDNFVGIVHDKSTWARQGLSVFNTVIEPGWKGFLTLELVFHGNTELIIPAGAGIAQVIFHELSCPVSYDGKYQGQADEPVPSKFDHR